MKRIANTTQSGVVGSWGARSTGSMLGAASSPAGRIVLPPSMTMMSCRNNGSGVAMGLSRGLHRGHSGLWGTNNPAYATTILCVRKGNSVVMVGDGQVTMGDTVVKPNARKVRQIRPGIMAGFAGATADAFTLFERLEEKIEEHQGQLLRSCVDLAKQWRTDKYLRRLEALMVVADKNVSLTLTGTGDVIEPHDGIIAIGSGGNFALACARGLIDIPDLDAETIALKSMRVAADLCIHTNHNFVVEKVNIDEDAKDTSRGSILSAPDQEKKEY